MSIFDRLKRAADPRARVLKNDLGRLDKVQSGLGNKAVKYVLTGNNETVLATLSNTCKGDELDVGKHYLQHKSSSWPRRQLLARQDPVDIDFSRRYGEVLSAACSSLPDSAIGSEKVPKLVRVFFSEAFEGVREQSNRWPPNAIKIGSKGLSLERALEVTRALGGDPVDFVDVVYNERGRYGDTSGQLYRKAVSLKPMLESHPDWVIQAGKRIYAASRATLIQDLHEFGLVDRPEYLDFVLNLAGDSSKAVRERAISVLSCVNADRLEPLAIEKLAKGNVNLRAGMVEVLSKAGTDSALEALIAHRENEKTARVKSAIDTLVTVSRHAEPEHEDDARHYWAIDGSVVEIPALRALPDEDAPTFGEADRKMLISEIDQENERIKQRNEEMARRNYRHRTPLIKHQLAALTVKLFNDTEVPERKLRHKLFGFLTYGPGARWARTALVKLPLTKALRLSAAISRSLKNVLSPYSQGPFTDIVREFLHGPHGDFRHVEAIEAESGAETSFGYGSRGKSRPVQSGDFLRSVIQDDYAYMEPQFDNVPSESLWPYLAQNLDVIDEAFGIKPEQGVKLSRVGAIRVLNRLPKAPARYFGTLLEAATGETKAGRVEARKMLAEAPDVEQHVVALLNDSRQAIRAGAAEWIAERHQSGAVPSLKTRLKKEKSELARAAILTTLEALGEDMSGIIGPKALLDEATKGLKRAKLNKLDWLGLDHLPPARYRSNTKVPNDVLKWWIFLAVKLKQPGGNALFDIYLERLKPEDAETFSTWILDSWFNYDTARPSEAEGNEYAKTNAPQRFTYMKKWYKDYTEEQCFADLKRDFMSNYLNSGAATKGILALAKRASPAIAADRVRSYLKTHGARTSQASSLLELLAAIGHPVTLQVLISAATRLKQKGVQKFAGTLVEKVAEMNHWTLDELADRTVPSAGLDETGVLELPCGPDEKIYKATLSDSMVLVLANPDGKPIKSLPSGPDDSTKASKKQLSASRRELKQVVAMQTDRFYEALCAERVWPLKDWKRDLCEHPIMRRLTERVVWFGLNPKGEIIGSFRPTAEGDFTDAEDQDIAIDSFHSVRLAYGSLMDETESNAWETHLVDYEIKPLFTQFGRKLLKVEEKGASETTVTDRKGWVTDTFSIRGAATKLGYERGEAQDAGFFYEYTKGFRSANIVAVIEFTGNCLPEENLPAALISLSFERYRAGRRAGGTLVLGDVPPVLLSECWNDYRTLVAKGAYDEQWEKKMPW